MARYKYRVAGASGSNPVVKKGVYHNTVVTSPLLLARSSLSLMCNKKNKTHGQGIKNGHVSKKEVAFRRLH